MTSLMGLGASLRALKISKHSDYGTARLKMYQEDDSWWLPFGDLKMAIQKSKCVSGPALSQIKYA
jgi:hypothetical protein